MPAETGDCWWQPRPSSMFVKEHKVSFSGVLECTVGIIHDVQANFEIMVSLIHRENSWIDGLMEKTLLYSQ